jgi:multimeric flavodoxin WrbA
VGNDSDTTSQYGGTGHGGDIGTLYKDSYGLETAMGTGRRIGDLVRRLSYERELSDSVNVLFLILQDRHHEAQTRIKNLLNAYKRSTPSTINAGVNATVVDITEKRIQRCLACDFCPTHIDVDEVYRCIIKSSQDSMQELHQDLLHHDVIIPVVFSANDTSQIVNNYQTFIERTRYLRRGDYVFSNQLVAPLTFEEIGVRENYSMRMMTSMLRHHTVMSRPMIGHVYNGEVLNQGQIEHEFRTLIAQAKRLTAARLAEAAELEISKYNPIGYILSTAQDEENERLNARMLLQQARQVRLQTEAATRLKPVQSVQEVLNGSRPNAS